MTSYDVNTIAKWFVSNNSKTVEHSYDGHLLLHKLLYFSEVFYYALNKEKLMKQDPVGYKRGPVYQTIYVDHMHYSLVGVNADTNFIEKATEEFLKVINFIFGSQKANYLSGLTHEQSPWLNKEQDCIRTDYNPILNIDDLNEEEIEAMKNVYSMYEDFDVDSLTLDKIGENIFIYEKNLILSEADLYELNSLEKEDDSIFIEKFDGELVYG